jgi:hypothetical protein
MGILVVFGPLESVVIVYPLPYLYVTLSLYTSCPNKSNHRTNQSLIHIRHAARMPYVY